MKSRCQSSVSYSCRERTRSPYEGDFSGITHSRGTRFCVTMSSYCQECRNTRVSDKIIRNKILEGRKRRKKERKRPRIRTDANQEEVSCAKLHNGKKKPERYFRKSCETRNTKRHTLVSRALTSVVLFSEMQRSGKTPTSSRGRVNKWQRFKRRNRRRTSIFHRRERGVVRCVK